MTTTNTGQGLAVSDAESQLLEMRPRQTRAQKLTAFAKAKPLGAVSAVIILVTDLGGGGLIRGAGRIAPRSPGCPRPRGEIPAAAARRVVGAATTWGGMNSVV